MIRMSIGEARKSVPHEAAERIADAAPHLEALGMISRDLQSMLKSELPSRHRALERAHSLLRLMALTDTSFGALDFNNVSLRMTLDLFVNQMAGRTVSVSSACIASGGPPTTALRHLKALRSEGLIERLPDIDDNRRIYVRLTDDMIDRLVSMLAGWN